MSLRRAGREWATGRSLSIRPTRPFPVRLSLSCSRVRSEHIGHADHRAATNPVSNRRTKKEPVPGISENGREMLALYEQLPERQQILLIGRLQEMVEPLASPNEKDIAIASDGEAI